MKKVFSLLITLAMLVSVAVVPMSVSADASVWDGTTVDTEWAGEGTQASPYLITSAAELAGLASIVYNADSTTTGAVPVGEKGVHELYTGTYFKLTTDIDLGGKEWLPIGRLGMRFNGTFDGDCHTIKNLKMENMHFGMGLFGGTGTNASISNVGIENADFTFAVNRKALTDLPAEGKDKTYFNVTNLNDNGTTATHTRLWGVGSLVGIFGGGNISGCYAKDVTITNTGDQGRNAGGLLGAPYSATQSGLATTPMAINDCYVNGVVLSGNFARSGGMYGSSKMGSSGFDHGVGTVFTNCYATNASGSFAWSFGDSDSNSYDKWNNCFTTKAFYTNTASPSRYQKEQSVVSTKAEIIEYFTAVNSWCADNEIAPINDGFPVLKGQNTWSDKWDGTSVDTTWAGQGTEADPYLITSAAELAGIAKVISETDPIASGLTKSKNTFSQYGSTEQYYIYTDKYFKLTKDIDLAEQEWLPIGSIGLKFNGHFDGDEHVISNLKMTTERSATGVFGAIGQSARIKDLGVDGVDIRTRIGSLGGNSTAWNTYTRCSSFGGFVGQMEPGGTEEEPIFKNCFAKNVYIEPTAKQMGIYGMGGFIGNIASPSNVGESTNYNRFYVSDCYVQNVELYSHSIVGAFIGRFSNKECNPMFTNCYAAGDICLENTTGEMAYTVNEDGSKGSKILLPGSTSSILNKGYPEEYDKIWVVRSNGTEKVYTFDEWRQSYNFGFINPTSATAGSMENCFTTSSKHLNRNNASGVPSATVVTGSDAIAKALVTGNNAWNLDSVKNPVNGGYPVLGWEKYWTVDTDPQAFYKGAGVTVTDGNVTAVTVIQSDSAVTGTVVVAVYNGDRFEGATTATAVNGTITLTTPLAADAGDTVKVFVWNSLDGVSPLADVYSTTVTGTTVE